MSTGKATMSSFWLGNFGLEAREHIFVLCFFIWKDDDGDADGGGDGGGRSDDGTQFPGSARWVNKITDVKDSTMPHVKSPPDKFGQLWLEAGSTY